MQILMNVLEIMDVIICAIILMVHSIAIVIQAIYYIRKELFAQVNHHIEGIILVVKRTISWHKI